MRCVEVHWIDSETDTGWEETEKVPPKLVKSIGYYHSEDDYFIYIHADTDGNLTNRRMKIPWCSIKEVIELPPIEGLK